MKQEMEYYMDTIPEVGLAARGKETLWLNPNKTGQNTQADVEISSLKIRDAGERLKRFAPYIQKVFPETSKSEGIIESELREIPEMKKNLNIKWNAGISGKLLLKMDSHLPISGSVKARGGIYEILKYAEQLALLAGLLSPEEDYSKLAGPEFRKFFGQYKIQVGSTGNLGLSIGIISAKLGFQVIVHMSADARQWKKDLLRSKGVQVIEYKSDYGAAVAQGRKESDSDPMSYFVDDENSEDLFLGYAVAGERVKRQLEEMKIQVDREHPLFVYLPCGIGGAPGGVAYGLKQIYGNHVHCFFTEPVQACCMLFGMATGLHHKVCVQDFGISGKTEADGLAVGRPSAFVGKLMKKYVSGISTIEDKKLYQLMKDLMETENIFIEPSACASFAVFLQGEGFRQYIENEGLTNYMEQAVHIAWATGGNMVPEKEAKAYLAAGEEFHKEVF